MTFSVLTVVANHEQALRQWLEYHDYFDDIIIISNDTMFDGSPVVDNTRRVAELSRATVIKTNRQLADSINIGLNECKSDYCFVMDVDLFLTRERYEIIKKFVEENPDYDNYQMDYINNIIEFNPNPTRCPEERGERPFSLVVKPKNVHYHRLTDVFAKSTTKLPDVDLYHFRGRSTFNVEETKCFLS